MKEENNVGQKIRNFRHRAGLSQFKLEGLIDASPGSISRIENGEVNPSKETLIKIIDLLNLTSIEASSLFGLEVKDISNILKISKEILDAEDLNEVLQKAVNDLVYELNLLSSFITLKKGNKLFAELTTTRVFSNSIFKIIGVPFNSLNVDLEKDKDNLCVKCFLTKKSYVTTKLDEITIPAVSMKISKLMERVTGFKSGLVLPIIFQDEVLGTFFVGKNFIDDYTIELPLLEEFTNHIAAAIVKLQSKNSAG